MEASSSKSKMEKGGRTWSAKISDSVEGHSTIPAISPNTEKGSTNSAKIEPEVKAPDGGWGWVIVISSFFTQLIGG